MESFKSSTKLGRHSVSGNVQLFSMEKKKINILLNWHKDEDKYSTTYKYNWFSLRFKIEIINYDIMQLCLLVDFIAIVYVNKIHKSSKMWIRLVK